MDILVLNVDSRLRDKTQFPNPNYFQINLPECIRDVTSIRLSSVEYPNVEKLIQPSRENNSFAVNDEWFTLTEGSYSAYQLVTALNNIVAYLNISVSSNSFTGQVTFESKDDSVFSLYFPKGLKGYPSLGSILGFSTTTYSGDSAYTSESTINVAADPYIFLRLNDFGSVISPGVVMKRALAKVILTTGVFTMVMDNGSNLVTKKHDCNQPLTLYRLTVELVDYLGYRLSSDSNFSFTLEVSFIMNSFLKGIRSHGRLGDNNSTLPQVGSLLLADADDDASDDEQGGGNGPFDLKYDEQV